MNVCPVKNRGKLIPAFEENMDLHHDLVGQDFDGEIAGYIFTYTIIRSGMKLNSKTFRFFIVVS